MDKKCLKQNHDVYGPNVSEKPSNFPVIFNPSRSKLHLSSMYVGLRNDFLRRKRTDPI